MNLGASVEGFFLFAVCLLFGCCCFFGFYLVLVFFNYKMSGEQK